MEMKLRKLWPILGAVCASLLASSLQADNQYGNMQQGGDSCCDPCLFQGLYERGTYREITPCAGPRVFSGWDVVVTADYIYWKAVQDGTAYATSGVYFSPSPAATPFASVATGKQRSVGQDWSSGFKVGLGFDMCHDCWDVMVQYTWLRPSHHSHLSATGPSDGTSDDCGCPEEPSLGNQVVAQFLGGGSYSTLVDDPLVIGDSASSRWKMDLNVIDLELGRNFYLSQHLTMRPHIGLKGTWQKQNIHTSIRGPFFQIPLDDETTLAVSGPYRMHFKNRTYGVGIRGGFDLSWYLSRSVSIFGNLAWSAMWTDYDRIHRVDNLCNCTASNDPCSCECADEECKKVLGINKQCGPKRYYSIKYVGEMELGLRWETWLCDESYHFAIQAGWEEQVWINWSTFAQVIGEGFHDLTFHGLNLKFRFDF